MPIRVKLTDADIRNIRLWPQTAPIEGVVAAARHIARGNVRVEAAGGQSAAALETARYRRVDVEIARLAVELLSLPARPSFLDVHAPTVDAAIDRLLTATCREMTDDFTTLAGRGLRLPGWTVELAGGDHRLRVDLAHAIRHLYDLEVAPRLARLQPLADLAHEHRLQELAGGGIDALLGGLHPCLQWLPPHTVQLTVPGLSVDFQVDSLGTGVVVAPRPWPSSTPALSLPGGEDSSRPMMIFYPVSPALRGLLPSNSKSLSELLGSTRARILRCIAERPGLSTQELAGLVGVSPASASEHATVLRRNRLVVTTRLGHRAVHTISRLGAQLVRE